jgi:NAD(P)-dependent dehydrogenase (short-subunit alcohol dehydrogenase family)
MIDKANTKYALVTGGNHGIGLETCRILAADYGFNVFCGCM